MSAIDHILDQSKNREETMLAIVRGLWASNQQLQMSQDHLSLRVAKLERALAHLVENQDDTMAG